MIFEILLIIVVAFVLRFQFIIGRTCDQDFHFFYLKHVEKNRLRHPELEESIVKGYWAYPALPHVIVALFPKDLWPIIGRLLNIVYDILSILIVYILSVYVLSSASANKGDLGFMSPQGWVALLYATSPLLFPITARLKAMGGRTIGPLLQLMYFALLGYAYIYQYPLVSILAIPFGALTILASIFGFQVMVAFSVLLSVMLWSPWPVAVLTGSILLSLVIPGTDAGRILYTNWSLYKWYIKVIDKNSPIANRNKLSVLWKAFVEARKEPIRFIQTLFENNSWFIALYSSPVLLILIVWISIEPSRGYLLTQNRLMWFLTSLIGCSFFVFILTSMRPLIIFGQAERYLEYTAPAMALLFVLVGLNIGCEEVYLPVLLVNIVFVLINFVLLLGDFYLANMTSKAPTALKECSNALMSIENPRVLTIPTELTLLLSTHCNNQNTKYHFDWIAEYRKGYSYMLDDRVLFQFARPDFEYYVKKYGVDTVVVRKRYLEKAAKLGIRYSFERYHRFYENDEYMIYSLLPV